MIVELGRFYLFYVGALSWLIFVFLFFFEIDCVIACGLM